MHHANAACVASYFTGSELNLSSAKSRCMWLRCVAGRPQSNLRRAPLRTTMIHAGGKSWPLLHQLPLGVAPAHPQDSPPTCYPLAESMRVLGVHFDTHFTSTTHLAVVKARCVRRVAILRRLAPTTWGCPYGVLRATYLALISNCVAYGITACGPYVAAEH